MNIRHSDYHLEISSLSHDAMTGRTIEGVLVEESPDWISIYGDTNSTFAGALTAAKGLGGQLDYSKKFNGKGDGVERIITTLHDWIKRDA